MNYIAQRAAFIVLLSTNILAMERESLLKKLPKPSVFINEWQNLTKHEIVIYSLFPRIDLVSLKPGQTTLLNEEIIPSYPPIGVHYNLYAALISEPKGYVQIQGTYYPIENIENKPLKTLEFAAYSVMMERVKKLSPIEFSVKSYEDSPIVKLHVITQGDKFEQTKIIPYIGQIHAQIIRNGQAKNENQ